MSDQNRENSFSPFLVGVVIGAALTYFFTTKKGKKLKAEILSEGAQALERLGEELEGKTPEIREKIAQISQDAKEKLEESTTDIPEQVQKIQNKGRRFFFRKSRTES